jgi:hypothetical protein
VVSRSRRAAHYDLYFPSVERLNSAKELAKARGYRSLNQFLQRLILEFPHTTRLTVDEVGEIEGKLERAEHMATSDREQNVQLRMENQKLQSTLRELQNAIFEAHLRVQDAR